jgi:ferredoxin-NADP reductase
VSSDPAARWTSAEVVDVRPVATDVRRIELAWPRSARALPGSHVDVRVQADNGEDVRSYSVVESSPDGSRVAISVLRTRTSRGGSRFMHALEPGDRLQVTQPLQNFPLGIGSARYVLLAGGIGVTAVIEMARVLRSLKADYRLVYVGRSRERLAYLADLESLHGDRLEVHVDDEGSALDVGALVAQLDDDLGRRTELYMCGPIRLMEAVRRAWVERDLPLHNLRFETFGNSGWFESEDFVVRVPELGIETRVGAGCTLLEALTEAGADVMYDCRKGECGLCEVRVAAVTGAIDHRDVFLSESQKQDGARICTCVSRVARDATARGGGDPVLTLSLG